MCTYTEERGRKEKLRILHPFLYLLPQNLTHEIHLLLMFMTNTLTHVLLPYTV